MPIARFEMPDGRVARFEVPEGTTPERAQQMIQSMLSGQAQAQSAPDPTEGMSTAEKFLAGTGKAMVDVARGVRQYLPKGIGGLTPEQIAEARQLDAPLMRTGAGVAGNVFGNVAMALPSMAIPGAATLPGAAAIGAGYGALQPAESGGERLKNVAIGAGASAIVPAAIRGGQVAQSFIDPLNQAGRNRILGRTLRDVAGGQADEALANLRNARPLVPGSMPTVGEAAGVPSIAALQRTATATNPAVMNDMVARQAAQNQARIAALQNVTPEPMAARAARQAAAGPLYEQAGAQGMNQQVAQQLQPQLQALMQRVPDDVVAQARRLAQVAGEPIEDVGSVRGAHYLKKAIDAQISQARRAGDNQATQAYQGLQTAYLDLLDQVSPGYAAARQTYASMSPPVNQGEVLQNIAQRATNFRGDMTPAALARAVNDQTARTVTRNPAATLQGTLSPDQMATLRNIQADLLRSDFAQTAGRGVGSDTVQKLAYSNMMGQAGIPSAVQRFGPAGVLGNVAQRAGQIVYRDANEALSRQLAEAMLDPAAAAQLMQSGVVTPQVQALIQNLRRGGAAIGASTPGLVQANQQ